MKILVVDDDVVDRMTVCRELKKFENDVEIDEAKDIGTSAGWLMNSKYDCILLDYMLPDGDGYVFLNFLRENNIHTPVVMLTGQTDERLIVELLRAGASDYISKNGLTSEVLQHCIKTATRLYYADKDVREAQQALQQSHAELKEAHRNLQETHEQLLQSEKMASIGQLAAGVAHEINNPVGYVSSNLATLKDYVDDIFEVLDGYEKLETLVNAENDEYEKVQELKKKLDIEYLKDDLKGLVNESREGIERVKGIVQDLKDFSHVDEAEWQWTDIHRGIDSTLNIVNNEIKYKAKVIKEYADLPDVECLASQINQVFMNLLVNAAHAIEEQGTITVRTGTQGDEIWVEVIDTGKGIAPEHINKIFEPFFTTKGVGKGTGLGLSLSYGIVNKHHGRFEVESEVNKGSRFKVWLPISQHCKSGADSSNK